MQRFLKMFQFYSPFHCKLLSYTKRTAQARAQARVAPKLVAQQNKVRKVSDLQLPSCGTAFPIILDK